MDFGIVLDEIRENKKSFIIVLVLIFALIVISVLNFFFKDNNQSLDIEGAVEEFGRIYYEETYYPEVHSLFGNNANDRLQKLEIDGIKLTLRNIVNIFEEVDAKNFYKKGSYCDFTQTYALIHPKYPYSKKDYDIKVVTSCSKEI